MGTLPGNSLSIRMLVHVCANMLGQGFATHVYTREHGFLGQPVTILHPHSHPHPHPRTNRSPT